MGDETVSGVDAVDLLESVGEIGGETDSTPGMGADKYSFGDLVGIGGNGGGRCAAEMLASKVWKDALAAGEYKLLGCIMWGGGARWNWLK